MLKVIGAGFGRTGTTSLHAALEVLGFPCYQMLTIIAQPERARLWDAAAHGEPVDWEEVFSGFQASVDLPGLVFWRELVDAYPDAKVILSVRDPDRWYESVERTILHMAPQSQASGLESPPVANLFPPEFQRMTANSAFQRTFGGLVGGREQAIEVFERHNKEVQRYVPAERLLVYEVTEGWEPLCAFLGVPVPAGTPFPHLNDTEAFRALRERLAFAAEEAAAANE
ncbi:MAG: sulfotransferase family protein [Egibacteraceae bacterium]